MPLEGFYRALEAPDNLGLQRQNWEEVRVPPGTKDELRRKWTVLTSKHPYKKAFLLEPVALMNPQAKVIQVHSKDVYKIVDHGKGVPTSLPRIPKVTKTEPKPRRGSRSPLESVSETQLVWKGTICTSPHQLKGFVAHKTGVINRLRRLRGRVFKRRQAAYRNGTRAEIKGFTEELTKYRDGLEDQCGQRSAALRKLSQFGRSTGSLLSRRDNKNHYQVCKY